MIYVRIGDVVRVLKKSWSRNLVADYIGVVKETSPILLVWVNSRRVSKKPFELLVGMSDTVEVLSDEEAMLWK